MTRTVKPTEPASTGDSKHGPKDSNAQGKPSHPVAGQGAPGGTSDDDGDSPNQQGDGGSGRHAKASKGPKN